MPTDNYKKNNRMYSNPNYTWAQLQSPPPAPQSKPNEPLDFDGSRFGIKESNVWFNKMSDSAKAYRDNTLKAADKKREIIKDAWSEQAGVISNKNTQAEQDLAAREKQVNTDLNKYKTDTEWRRKDLGNVVQTQKDIAWRQANIAAAQAGNKWVWLSVWQRQQIRDDIISKYATNIANVQQYEFENNRKIDDDLKNTWLKQFEVQGNIDQLKQKLTDEKYAPILEAIKKASEWDQKAIEDVNNFYQSFVRKRWDETYKRWAEAERLNDIETQFALFDADGKRNYITSKLKNLKWFDRLTTDQIVNVINQWGSFANMTRRLRALATEKIKQDKMDEIQKTWDQQVRVVDKQWQWAYNRDVWVEREKTKQMQIKERTNRLIARLRNSSKDDD